MSKEQLKMLALAKFFSDLGSLSREPGIAAWNQAIRESNSNLAASINQRMQEAKAKKEARKGMFGKILGSVASAGLGAVGGPVAGSIGGAATKAAVGGDEAAQAAPANVTGATASLSNLGPVWSSPPPPPAPVGTNTVLAAPKNDVSYAQQTFNNVSSPGPIQSLAQSFVQAPSQYSQPAYRYDPETGQLVPVNSL